MFLAEIAEVGRIVGAISRDVSFLVEGCFLHYVHNRSKLVYSTPREPLGHIFGNDRGSDQNVSQQKPEVHSRKSPGGEKLAFSSVSADLAFAAIGVMGMNRFPRMDSCLYA